MMNNNKILTVSYGTFSCTLEGFDDSFGTMKAIAEYFRGLASEDRYFGAEPPQPDADMLARIAQKEISRRVEAREHEGKIVLSALEDQRDAPAPEKEALPKAAPAAAVVAAAAESTPIATDVTDHEPAAPVTATAPAETAPEIEAEVPAAEIEAEVPTALVDVQDVPDAVEEDVTQHVDEPNDIVPGQPDAEVEAFFAESKSAQIDDDIIEDLAPAQAAEAAAAKAVEDTPAPDSIAAKLQRIRAVVAQHEDDDEDDDYLEDQHADAAKTPAAKAAEVNTDTRADADDAQDVDETTQAAQTVKAGDIDEYDGNDSIMAFDTEDEIEDETDSALANLFDGKTEAPAANVDATDAPRARVIKVKRADLEAAIEQGDLEEYEDDNAAPVQNADDRPGLDDLAPAKTSERTLSPEDEDALVKELASLEADIQAEDASQTAPAADARRAARGDDLPSIDDETGSNMNRLMAETDHQMDEPESATRRDAFAHLRAAVAARNADETMNSGASKKDEDGAYRDDLAEVVRPRRPVNTAKRTERPNEGRPAPLKLVAEQRIDVDKPQNTGPVRPRRVAAVVEPTDVFDGDESFADFAAEMGAVKLPQLLEAAAAYMSFVEGRAQFSRPQLMNTVRQAGPEQEFSREDGLRSFGQLLRAGKIEKLKGGRFTVSEDIGYRPDERAAG